MPRPQVRPGLEPLEEDVEELFGRSIVRDDLSRISEGTYEGGSITSSAFQSAASSALMSFTSAGVLRAAVQSQQQLLQQHHTQQQPQRRSGTASTASAASSGSVGGSAAERGFAGAAAAAPAAAAPAMGPATSSRSTGSDSGRSTGGASPSADASGASPEQLKRIVKTFVEVGVRGQRIEALRPNGQPAAVTYRLSRQVDAFEIAGEGGRGVQRVELTEVVMLCVGGPHCPPELGAAVPGAADARCAFVDLRDGRCLTLRFPSEQEAATFVQCMRLFVQELTRERGAGTPQVR